jgi:hypothetical protein
LNNPLKYTDPDGEWVHLVIGAAIGGFTNWAMNGFEFSWKGLGYFGVGAVTGALSAGVGVGIQTASAGASFFAGFVGSSQGISTILSVGYTSSFLNGAAAGFGAGFVGGFGNSFGNGLMQGQNFKEALWSGTKTGIISGTSAGLIGGIGDGIRASLNGKDFWTGKADVYRSPINDNYGTQNGECALRCFEEFSNSYGMDQYDYNYWYNQNGSKLGVAPYDVENLVNNSNTFLSNRVAPDINALTDALSNNQRLMAGFQTNSGGAHAVMINKIKVWPNGNYKIWLAETSPVRIAPTSIKLDI